MPIKVSAELPENIIFDKLSIDEDLSNEYELLDDKGIELIYI